MMRLGSEHKPVGQGGSFWTVLSGQSLCLGPSPPQHPIIYGPWGKEEKGWEGSERGERKRKKILTEVILVDK